MANQQTLLPCPFCGAKAKAKQQDPYPPEQPKAWWTIECSHGTRYHHKRGNGCPVMPAAWADTIEEATEEWNTRNGLSKLDADRRMNSQCRVRVPCLAVGRGFNFMHVSPGGKVTWVSDAIDGTIFARREAEAIAVSIRVITNNKAEVVEVL